MSENPRRILVMSLQAGTTTDSPYFPDPRKGAVSLTTSGTGYNVSESQADSVFHTGEDVIIYHARLDKAATANVTIREGPSGGTAEVIALSSVLNVSDAKIKGPFHLPGGFHIIVSVGSATLEIEYEVVPAAD